MPQNLTNQEVNVGSGNSLVPSSTMELPINSILNYVLMK